jgi:hypothetical protein
MTTQEKRKFLISPQTRELYWEDLMGECLKKQQMLQLRLVRNIENLSLRLHAADGSDSKFRHVSATQPLSGFQLQSFLESIQFSSSVDEINVGCGLGSTCQSKVTSSKPKEQANLTMHRDEDKLIVTEIRDPIKREKTKDPEHKEQITKQIREEGYRENLVAEAPQKFVEKLPQNSRYDQLADSSSIRSGSKAPSSQNVQENLMEIDSHVISSKKEAMISPVASIDRLTESVQSLQSSVMELKEYMSQHPYPTALEPQRTRIRFEDFPSISFPKQPIISSESSMQVIRQQVNKAVESLSTIQRQLRIRKQFIIAKAAKVDELEMNAVSWNEAIASKTNALSSSLVDVVQELLSLLTSESKKAKSLYVSCSIYVSFCLTVKLFLHR